jgi:hypothetical protein
MALWGCDETTGPDPVDIPVPTVTGISATTVSPGDTLIVTGSDFDENTSLNRVVFSNTLARAVPFGGSGIELRVVVPRNALSGALSVTRAGQTTAGVGPEVTVLRDVGDVFVVGGARSVDIPTPPGSEYLVIPHATGGAPTEFQYYDLAGAELPPAASAAPVASSPRFGAGMTAEVTPREAFESRRWEMAREIRARAGTPPRSLPGAAAAAPVAPQQLRGFNVWNNVEGGDPTNLSNYTRVTAELRYQGTHVLVYADVDTLASGNLTQADLRGFGELFDQEARPSATKYFGTESDVDNNDRVIMLVTPVVNRLTPPDTNFFYGGFFFSIDLYPTGGTFPSGTTNHAEIFYLLASDPTGVWGNDQPRAFVAAENIRTIVHEYEHLISFSYRLFNQPANSDQVTWLEEGMAHMAEDLLALETGDPSFNNSNEGRGRRFRLSPYGYNPQFPLTANRGPGRISLEDSRSPIEQRGGIYLFLRLLGDRYGNQIYKQILQSDCIGRECIQAITGENFYDTLGDFLAAMYLSGTGVTDDPRYNYSSINLNDFGTLFSTDAAFDGADQVYAGSDVGLFTHQASGDFFVLSGSSTATSRVTLSNAGARMAPRTLFVRIK